MSENSLHLLIKAGKSSTAGKLLCKKNQPVNKLVEKQRSFFSTKRKRKQTNVRIRKPTGKQKDIIYTALMNGEGKLPLTTNTISK